jgi:ribosome-binding factor A
VGDEDPKTRAVVLKSLTRGAGRLRRLIAPRLELRRSPELRFHYDAGHDASRRVEELLHEIKSEGQGAAAAHGQHGDDDADGSVIDPKQ